MLFFIYKGDNEEAIYVDGSRSSSSYTLDIERLDWENSLRYKDKLSTDNHFRGVLKLVESGYPGLVKDNVWLEFNLMPSIPSIVDPKFDYIYNWEYDDIYPNGNLSFQVVSKRAETIVVAYTDEFLFTTPKELIFRIREVIDVDSSNICHQINNKYADWGMFYKVSAINKYGGITGNDTIFTTDNIKDPAVLARIEEMRKVGGTVDAEYASCRFFYNPKSECITITGDVDSISNLQIISSNGQMVKSIDNNIGSVVDLGSLPNGLYIVVYKTNERCETYKFIKS